MQKNNNNFHLKENSMEGTWKKALNAYKMVFGKKPDLSEFYGRIRFQKTIYLLKTLGINFIDVDFTWYHRGPYSFKIAGLYPKTDGETDKFTEKEEKIILENKSKLIEFLDNEDNAELYSSIAFLIEEEQLNKEQVIEKMSLMKSWFEKLQVEKGFETISSFLKEKRIS